MGFRDFGVRYGFGKKYRIHLYGRIQIHTFRKIPDSQICPNPDSHMCSNPDSHICPNPDSHICPNPDSHICPYPDPQICSEPSLYVKLPSFIVIATFPQGPHCHYSYIFFRSEAPLCIWIYFTHSITRSPLSATHSLTV